MDFLARLIVRYRRRILLAAFLLFIPGLIGQNLLKIEYDLTTFLPSDTPAATGQRILDQEFGQGSTVFLFVQGKVAWQVEQLKKRVAAVPGVRSVAWVDDLVDIAVPEQYLDQTLLDQFIRGDATIMQVMFTEKGTTPETRAAIDHIRGFLGENEKLVGQVITLDEMRTAADRERPRMLLISVALVTVVLLLAVASPVVPFLFLATLGFAIVCNLGLSFYLGHRLSYLTNSVVAALQLGVSLDFCLFLWERYREERQEHEREEAMRLAIHRTATAVLASSITTVLGFIALAAMRNGLGADLGLTMARGVLFSLISCLTILPALLLACDRYIFAWRHRSLLPDLHRLAAFVPRAKWLLFAVFLILFLPALFGYGRMKISYNLESTFPSGLPSIQAAREMREVFGAAETVNLVTEGLTPYELDRLVAELEKIPGFEEITAYGKLVDPAIPAPFVPDKIRDRFVAGNYVNTTIMLADQASSPTVAAALARAEEILRPHDGRAFLTGQAVIVNDLGDMARQDIPRVNILSIVLITATIAAAFLSLSLPVLLVLAIQLSIWLNQGLSHYMGQEVFYFGIIAIGAIQLGATVDYAVLLTSRYREELAENAPIPAMVKAFKESARAILTSAATLFVATIGLYLGTSLDLVRDLVMLIARGATITVLIVLLVFPAVLLVCQSVIARTSLKWPAGRKKQDAPHGED